MKLTEAKQQFISSWGAFGTHWGINRTMAQIHALLLISPDPLTQDDIMEELNISRGNTNMNIRELINWGLVERVILPGERKEYFTAEKDIWKVVKQIVKERKKSKNVYRYRKQYKTVGITGRQNPLFNDKSRRELVCKQPYEDL